MYIEVEETRGAPSKYFDRFNNWELAEIKTFEFSTAQYKNTTLILQAAKRYIKKNGLDWKFRCYTKENIVYIVRVK